MGARELGTFDFERDGGFDGLVFGGTEAGYDGCVVELARAADGYGENTGEWFGAEVFLAFAVDAWAAACEKRLDGNEMRGIDALDSSSSSSVSSNTCRFLYRLRADCKS